MNIDDLIAARDKLNREIEAARLPDDSSKLARVRERIEAAISNEGSNPYTCGARDALLFARSIIDEETGQ